MNRLVKNKKGNIFQIFIILIILTAVAITGFLCLTMTNGVNSFWKSHPDIMPVNSTADRATTILQDTSFRTTDYAIFFLFLGLNIGAVISAVRTNFSATIIFLFILLTFLAVFVAAGVVNLYQGMAHTIPEVGSQLTLTNYVFSKYTPLIMCVMSALIIIIMYGKSGSDIVQ